MASESLKILHIASEMTPLLSTGGLAEVVNALPKAQRAQGHDVRVAMPCYQSIPWEQRGEQVSLCEAHLAGRTVHGALRQSVVPDSEIPLYLVEHEGYFGRSKPYGHDYGEYGDNAERFSFFCLAILDALPKTGWVPDVINCHDWHTAPFVIALKSSWRGHPEWGGKPVVYTIHNLNYQGRFGPDQLPYTGLDPSLMHGGCLEYFGDLNLMKGAITLADKVSTVSPRYAREIQTTDYGAGLDGVLRARGTDLKGILNGIDYDVWNPTKDPHLHAPYGKKDLKGKAACKAALQKVFGLPEKDVPLFGVVSRLTWQKGIDLVMDAFHTMDDVDFQLVMLGTGDTWLENRILGAAQHHAEKLGVILRYDTAIAHQIQAGSDYFLMPSRYEPCGLSQMYSFAYGTVPIVRRTGGLADSVRNLSRVHKRDGRATGIVFAAATSQAVARSMRQAVKLYTEGEAFAAMQATGMGEDFSWNRTCEDYLAMYRESLVPRMSQVLQLETSSAEQTMALGHVFARMLVPGAVVALEGDLASGKTTFVKGMAAHFAEGDPVHSPTFTLVNEYGAEPRLYHLDLYRLGGPAEVADLGYEDILDAGGISVVEWAGRAEGLLPERRVDITFEHGGGDLRRICIADHGVLPPHWQGTLSSVTAAL